MRAIINGVKHDFNYNVGVVLFVDMTDENGEDGIPPNYIQDNIQVPILDIPEFCRKLQDKYDKEWESKERKDRGKLE